VEEGRGLTLLDTLKISGVNLKVNYNSNPEINDWNEDGKKDLIVGEQTYVSPNTGNIRVYLNQGTNDNPVFTTYTVIESSGSDIYHYRADPRIFDLDRDGVKDLLVGESYGYIFFYRNIGTNANPAFAGYDTLKMESGQPIDAYYGARFGMVDWYGDGDYDIIVSGYDGYIEMYENTEVVGIGEYGHETIIQTLSISPNPVTNTATLSYTLVQPSQVGITVYGADGRYQSTMFDQYQTTGHHTLNWKADLPAGVYFVHMAADTDVQTVRMIIVR